MALHGEWSHSLNGAARRVVSQPEWRCTEHKNRVLAADGGSNADRSGSFPQGLVPCLQNGLCRANGPVVAGRKRAGCDSLRVWLYLLQPWGLLMLSVISGWTFVSNIMMDFCQ